MEISPTWLGVILIGITLLFFTYRGLKIYEFFQTDIYVKEGFTSSLTSDIQLNSCPANSTRFINSSGQSLCCDGNIVNNQCSGRTLCSLSEPTGTTPTCGEWYAAWLAERSASRCFPGMPNYYEDKTTGVKGCCEGPRKPDGSAPASEGQKKCILYNSQKDENEKEDSCSNMKLFDSVRCFTREIPETKKRFDRGSLISCSYQLNEGPIPISRSCLQDESLAKYLDGLGTQGDWRTYINNNWSIDNKLQICSVQQKVYIDKTHTREQLKNLKIF